MLISIEKQTIIYYTKRGHFAICTDSLSALNAISNTTNNNIYASTIRNILIKKYPKILLIWTPGHCQLDGNEFADKSAKEATNSPLIMTNNYSITDINKFLKTYYVENNNFMQQTSTWYKTININKLNINDFYKSNINRRDFIKFERLRLGHTFLSHAHIINLPQTIFCNCNINPSEILKHILCSCPKFQKYRQNIFKNIPNPKDILTNPTECNITKILTFLKETELYKLI